METETAGLIAAERYEAPRSAAGTATGTGCGRGTRASARSSSRSRRSGRGFSVAPGAAPAGGARVARRGQDGYVHGVSTRKVDELMKGSASTACRSRRWHGCVREAEPDSPPIAGAPCHDQTRRRNVRAKVPLGGSDVLAV